MRDRAVCAGDLPDRAEVLHVIVERQACGLAARVRDRNQQLELQRLGTLAIGDDLAAATEERIVGEVHFHRQLQQRNQQRAAFDPHLPERHHLVGAAEAHVLALPEHLHAARIERGFVAEAVRQHVDGAAVGGQRTAPRHHWIDRIAGGRCEHHAGRFLLRHPFVAAIVVAVGHRVVERAQQALVAHVVAAERVDRAGEIRKALQIFAVLEVVTAHGGRKAQHFRLLVCAEMRDRYVQTFHHVFENLAAAIQAVFAGIDQQAGGKQFVAKARRC